jgi:GcrA cell cycle regulator
MIKKLEDLPELTRKILKLWDEGYSASGIGNHLNMTRNAVMGKIHRARAVGVKVKRSRIVKPKPERKVKNRRIIRKAKLENKPLPPVPQLPPSPKARPKPVRFMGLRPSSCRFVVNDDRSDYLFCNAEKEVGSYCKAHADLCYMPPGRKKCLTEQLTRAGITLTGG